MRSSKRGIRHQNVGGCSARRSTGGGRALLVVGHGSREPGFADAMQKVARRLRRDPSLREVRCAYLEIASPSVPEALGSLVRKGLTEVFVLPYFLQSGRHVKKDLPKIVSFLKEQYGRRTKIRLCPYLGYHDKIVEVAQERLKTLRGQTPKSTNPGGLTPRWTPR